MTKEQKVQNLLKEIMDDISRFEDEKHKLIGLEVSAGLMSYLLAKKEDRYDFNIFDIECISDSRVAHLCEGFLKEIKRFVEFEGGTVEILISRLLKKTSRLGCLQVQNPQRFNPKVKMTGQ